MEKCLSKTEIKITSPDQILDKITGVTREVDVSLRARVGSHDVLIILECRDRRKSEDVTWIEQLATRRDDIGANKAIAVSSTGFTSGAKSKAHFKNIELRTLEDINIDDISDWFQVKNLKNRSISLNVATKIVLRHPHKDQKKVQKFIKKLKTGNIIEAKVILDLENEAPVSMKNLLCKKYLKDIESCVEPGIHTLIREGILLPQNQLRGFQLLIDDKKVVVHQIQYTAKIDVNVKEVPIRSIKSYKSDDSRLADIIRFEHSDFLEPNHSIEITGIPEGNGRKIGIRIVNNKDNTHK